MTQAQAEHLGSILATRIPQLPGVAHLCAGWRDLAAQLGKAVGIPPIGRSSVHRSDGVEVAVDGDAARVRIALALEWPHRAEDICRSVQAEAVAAAQAAGIESCTVHVAVRDVHLPPITLADRVAEQARPSAPRDRQHSAYPHTSAELRAPRRTLGIDPPTGSGQATTLAPRGFSRYAAEQSIRSSNSFGGSW
jgi:uncharacterized alkaline shock family protein YloU